MLLATQHQVTATELARNLSTHLDQVRASRKSIAITRGNRQVAQLAPSIPEGASVNTLKTLLDKTPLMAEAKGAYRKNLNEIRNTATLPPSPWVS